MSILASFVINKDPIMIEDLNSSEIRTIMNELDQARQIDYQNALTTDDLPFGHPCINPEKFFEWLIDCIEFCKDVCEEAKPHLDYNINSRMIKNCMKIAVSFRNRIRIYDYLDDGIENKFEELKAYEPDSDESNEYIDEIILETEHFKKLYCRRIERN